MSPHFRGVPPTKKLVHIKKIECALCDVMVLCIQFVNGKTYTRLHKDKI